MGLDITFQRYTTKPKYYDALKDEEKGELKFFDNNPHYVPGMKPGFPDEPREIEYEKENSAYFCEWQSGLPIGEVECDEPREIEYEKENSAYFCEWQYGLPIGEVECDEP